jgi:hypothetical protein
MSFQTHTIRSACIPKLYAKEWRPIKRRYHDIQFSFSSRIWLISFKMTDEFNLVLSNQILRESQNCVGFRILYQISLKYACGSSKYLKNYANCVQTHSRHVSSSTFILTSLLNTPIFLFSAHIHQYTGQPC